MSTNKIKELQKRALGVRNATLEGENTADRVGKLMYDMLDYDSMQTDQILVLNNMITALTKSDIIVVATLPDTGLDDTIYRVQGTGTYTDSMYYNGQWYTMATYNNAIDAALNKSSHNLVENMAVANAIDALQSEVSGGGEPDSIHVQHDDVYGEDTYSVEAGDIVTSFGNYTDMVIFFNREGSEITDRVNLTAADLPYVFEDDFDYIRCAEPVDTTFEFIKGYDPDNLDKRIDDLEAETERIDEVLGGSSSKLHIELAAYGNLNNINLPEGCVFQSLPGYADGANDLILCVQNTFDIEDANNVRIGGSAAASEPIIGYTCSKTFHSLRPTASINSTLTYVTEDAEGLIGRVEVLERNNQPEQGLKPCVVSQPTLATNGVINLEKNSIKNAKSLTFTGSFSVFSGLRVGHGYEQYQGSWLDIDNTTIKVYQSINSVTTMVAEFEHGLTLSHNISITIDVDIEEKARISLNSDGEIFTASEATWTGYNGNVFAQSLGTAFTDVTLSFNCYKYNAPVWVFGDSYINLNVDVRWPYYLIQDDYTDIMFNAFPGQNSASAVTDLLNCLKHGKPKHLIWTLGMNDADSQSAVSVSWMSAYNKVVKACKDAGVELVLATIPTVPSRIHKFKNNFIRSNESYRYIDFDKAVGANEQTGEWYEGMLEPNEDPAQRVHPTAKGARALYGRAIADAPELRGKE